MYTLQIVKTEYTLNGVNLDRKERFNHTIARAIGGIQNSEVVQHTTVLLDKPFKTAKAGWEYATPELIDSLGLVWDGKSSYNTDYANYDIDVVKIKK